MRALESECFPTTPENGTSEIECDEKLLRLATLQSGENVSTASGISAGSCANPPDRCVTPGVDEFETGDFGVKGFQRYQ